MPSACHDAYTGVRMELRERILVVDDEPATCAALSDLLRDEGYAVETASDGAQALELTESFGPALVLTDLRMPGMDGLELMQRVRADDPSRPVVVMTADDSIDTAVAAMRQGATDYLRKPIHADELMVVLSRALEESRLRAEASQLRHRLTERGAIKKIIGSSVVMQRMFDLILQVAPSKASVLITGESGTGKELIAEALHEHSPRASGPFVKLHCAALAETILESELFGHERGAFTGAAERRDGRFQQANGGTLFLDEIGEISPAIQVKLLRVLQERKLERVGGNQTHRIDVRILAATNRDLTKMVEEGRFREDLYYRLNVVAVEAPSLREREADIALLAMYFLRKFAAENGRSITRFSDEALVAMGRYRWPGNVRELENAVERAVVLCTGEAIRAADLPPQIVAPASPADSGPAIPGATLAELERHAILETLAFTGGSTSRAAEILGISPRKIQYKLREYQGGPPDADPE